MSKPAVLDFAAAADRATVLYTAVVEALTQSFHGEGRDSEDLIIAQCAAVRAADALVREPLEGFEIDIANAIAKQITEAMAAYQVPTLVKELDSPVEVVDQTASANTSFTNRVLEILRSQFLPIVNHSTRTAEDGDQYVRLAYAIASMALAKQLLGYYDEKVQANAPKIAEAFQAYLKDKNIAEQT